MGGGAPNLREELDLPVQEACQEARSLRGWDWVRAFGDQGLAGSHTHGLLHRTQEGGWSALETREPQATKNKGTSESGGRPDTH